MVRKGIDCSQVASLGATFLAGRGSGMDGVESSRMERKQDVKP